MFRPEPMLKVNILALNKFRDGLTRAIGMVGTVHLINAVEQSRQHLLEAVDVSTALTELEALHARCRDVMEMLNVVDDGRLLEEKSATPEAPSPVSLDIIRSTIQRAVDAYAKEDESINSLLAESGMLAREKTRFESYPFRRIRFNELRDLNHLYVLSGRIDAFKVAAAAESVGDRGLVLSEPLAEGREHRLVVLTSRKSRWGVESDLNNHGFTADEEPPETDDSAESRLRSLDSRLRKIELAVQKHRLNVLELGDKFTAPLRECAVELSGAIAEARAQQHFAKAGELVCVSGWVPEKQIDSLQNTIDEMTQGTAVIEMVSPEHDEAVQAGIEQVPVQFSSHPIMRPFQQIICAFGAPRYTDVEPSLFVALSFVLMFGIMFGDVGQGALIFAVGMYLLKSGRESLRNIREFGYLFATCGVSSVIFGFLYGSFFGSEEVLPHIWLNPLRDVMTLFKTAIVAGIVFISIGIIINIYNKLRNRDYFEGIFDKFGVVGIVFYWGSIGLGLKAAVFGRLGMLEVVLVVALPLLIIFIREPLYNLLCRKKKLLHEDFLSFFMESAIEVMETVNVFLGSTVSFVRVGAFALSHAAVCLAVYAIVEMIHELPGGTLWALLVIIIGNVFVILLEGMVVAIQGIRLQYYELFSKYFAGDGVLYDPFRTSGSTSTSTTTSRR